MNDNLKITLVQSNLKWHDKDANMNHFNKLLTENTLNTDIVILPEMFTTGFSMNSKQLAEKMDGESIKWMQNLSAKIDTVLVGSLIIEENGKYYNRLLWVYPDGNILKYDKRHLFRMAGENNFYTQGNTKIIIEYKDWRICPLVCYDLRFPVWSRNTEDYDLLIFIANWPEQRKKAWNTLLMARAIENQAYVAGVNRIGKDNNGINYSGNSVLIDPKGIIKSSINEYEESMETIELSMIELNNFRQTFPVKMDSDNFQIL
ncbi:MAG: amidohydrolase [Chlorobi bacterium]|nr:amidohydrolase [Chlorobiota bacterium]